MISSVGTKTACLTRHSVAAITRRTLTTLPVDSTAAHYSLVDLDVFRNQSFLAEKPFSFGGSGSASDRSIPASSKWFEQRNTTNGLTNVWSLSPHLHQFLDWSFPYELVARPGSQQSLPAFRDWLLKSQDITDQILAGLIAPVVSELGSRSFFQLYAPLKLLKLAIDFNVDQTESNQAPLQLYIAQSSLADLPSDLKTDLPTPSLVEQAGKGDVYTSSIWLGTEPTYTPLHRDPNPNLFCQLCSRKIVRLLPPAVGDRIFFEVQVQLRQQGSSRIRTLEMMEGNERELLHEAVWENESLSQRVYETELGPGEALFIPKGWWHSIKSRGTQGSLNGSANWWFR